MVVWHRLSMMISGGSITQESENRWTRDGPEYFGPPLSLPSDFSLLPDRSDVFSIS